MSEELLSVRLRVITPEQVVYDGPVDWAQIPLEDGLLGVWPEHAPLVACTGSGELEFSIAGVVQRLHIGAGVLRIDGSHCVVMYGATATSPQPERDLEALAARMEETLHTRLSDREVEELQQP
jgi:F-type H+-transporting ATPase subunit epsilon